MQAKIHQDNTVPYTHAETTQERKSENFGTCSQKTVERRDRVREARAEKVAQIENKIKKELLGRLKQGTHSEIYNFSEKAFNSVLDDEEIEEEENQEDEKQLEYVAEEEDVDLEPPLESGNDFVDENDVEDFGAFIDSGFEEADFDFNALPEESNDNLSPGNEKTGNSH